MNSKDIKKHFAHVIKSLNESLFIIDEQGLIIFTNTAAENLLGRTRKSLIGREWSDLYLKVYDSHGKELSYEDTPINKALSTTMPVCSSMLISCALSFGEVAFADRKGSF